MKNSHKIQNAIVLACAAGATFATLVANTTLFTKSNPNSAIERERCYGVSRAGQNDCATANHSCAAKSVKDHDNKEWIMLPKGLCNKLAGGEGG